MAQEPKDVLVRMHEELQSALEKTPEERRHARRSAWLSVRSSIHDTGIVGRHPAGSPIPHAKGRDVPTGRVSLHVRP